MIKNTFNLYPRHTLTRYYYPKLYQDLLQKKYFSYSNKNNKDLNINTDINLFREKPTLLTILDKIDPLIEKNNTYESQLTIEKILYNDYENIFYECNQPMIIDGINSDLLGKDVYTYIEDRKKVLKNYSNKLINSKNFSVLNLEGIVISTLDAKFVNNLALVTFLQIYSYQGTDYANRNVLVPLVIKLGKRMVNYNINISKDEYNKNNNDTLR